MREDKSARTGILGKGGYIALAMCMVIAGVVTILTMSGRGKAAQTKETEQQPAVVQQQPAAVAPVIEPEKVENITPVEEPVIQEEPAETVMEPEPVASAEELLPQVVSPLDGTTVTVFSMTELMYDETMADWRTHNGVDIQAGEGDAVKTAADGTVLSVKDDELMGTTVIIEHAGGYTTQYSSLKAEPPVEEGQSVSAGQIIGFVGATATAESSMGPHLHFSVSKDGELVDPREYVG